MASSRREDQQPDHRAKNLVTAKTAGDCSRPDGSEAAHPEDLQCVSEADPYGLNARYLRDIDHLAPDQVVGNEESPDLLPHTLWPFAPKCFVTLKHVSLELVVTDVYFTAFAVK